MRKAALLLLIATVSINCWAQSFASNSLGQKLSVTTSADVGYVLVEEGDTQTLYNNGELVFTKTTIYSSDGTETCSTVWKSTGKTVVEERRNGMMVRQTTVCGSSVETVSYHYEDGLLSFVIKSDEFGTEQVERYLRDPVDGNLVAVRRFGRTDIVGEKYVFTESVLYVQLFDGIVVQSDDFSVGEDGYVRYEEDGVVHTYSPEGLLTIEDGDGWTETYSYDGLVLCSSTKVQGDATEVSTYTNGVLSSKEVFDGGNLTSRTEYASDGSMVKTAYSGGRAVAVIRYADDGRTVVSMEYL